LTTKSVMIVPAIETVVVPVVAIIMRATVSVFKAVVIIRRVIMVPVMLMTMALIITAPAWPDIVLIMMVRMWRIGVFMTIAIIIVIRPFAVIVSVHNGIAAAIGSVTGIIRVLMWIMGASAEQ